MNERQMLSWGQMNPSEGVYNWKTFDAAYASAQSHGHQLGASLKCLSVYPDWVIAKGAKAYTAPQFGKGPMVLPFDPIVQAALVEFDKQLALHIDGKAAYLTMGGFGYETESYMPLPGDLTQVAGPTPTPGSPTPTPTPISNAAFISLWVSSSGTFIDAFGANLTKTPFVLAAGVPFKGDPGAQAALTTVFNRGRLYPLFGVMQWGLNAKSTTAFFINQWVHDTPIGGFQITGSETEPHVGGDLQGTLEEALQAAADMGANWVEVYGVDGENPALAPVLKKYNELLH